LNGSVTFGLTSPLQSFLGTLRLLRSPVGPRMTCITGGWRRGHAALIANAVWKYSKPTALGKVDLHLKLYLHSLT